MSRVVDLHVSVAVPDIVTDREAASLVNEGVAGALKAKGVTRPRVDVVLADKTAATVTDLCERVKKATADLKELGESLA